MNNNPSESKRWCLGFSRLKNKSAKPLTLLALTFTLLLTACTPEQRPPAPIGPPEVTLPAHYKWLSLDEAEQLIAATSDLQILDVRMEEEIRSGQGWIAKAVHTSYLDDNRRYLETLDKTKPYLVYCALGPRSELTAAEMAKMGFKSVSLLKGGFNAWLQAGKPLVR